MEAGFYKLEDGHWFYGPNSVLFPDETIIVKELKDTYTYPVNGWTWYDQPPQEYIEYINSLNSPPPII
jgi:hypothetical protein